MVGSAILRALRSRGFENIITRTHKELDLREQAQTREFYAAHSIDCVILAAAKVGGIHMNDTLPAQMIGDNLQIQTNAIHEAWRAGVKRLLFLGSSCIYPKATAQPIAENQLLTGHLEPTNSAYAVAKIAGIKMCEAYNAQYGTDYRSLMPTNLYGSGDYFHPQYSHVIPALIRKFHTAIETNSSQVAIWGTGKPLRDFLHVDDLAAAALHVLSIPADDYWRAVPKTDSHVNVGSGQEMSIRQCAEVIAAECGFEGEITFDADMPDGMARKILDISLIQSLGWRPTIDFKLGIRQTYQWFKENSHAIRGDA